MVLVAVVTLAALALAVALGVTLAAVWGPG
jgi:hypothetical protein